MPGVAMLATAQVIFARVDAPLARLVIALVFALPAGLAGYFAKRGLAALTMSSEIWQQVFAATGAIVVGATAWLRLADAPPHASASTIDHSTARDPGQTVT